MQTLTVALKAQEWQADGQNGFVVGNNDIIRDALKYFGVESNIRREDGKLIISDPASIKRLADAGIIDMPVWAENFVARNQHPIDTGRSR